MTHADIPLVFTEGGTDWLERGPAVQALRRLLDSPALATPLVVGIYGGWGTGKTSVMQTLEAELAAPERLMLWFDAWIYARQEQALWRALLLRVVEALRERTRTPDERGLQAAGYDKAKTTSTHCGSRWRKRSKRKQSSMKPGPASTAA